jgi:hypothetical protein
MNAFEQNDATGAGVRIAARDALDCLISWCLRFESMEKSFEFPLSRVFESTLKRELQPLCSEAVKKSRGWGSELQQDGKVLRLESPVTNPVPKSMTFKFGYPPHHNNAHSRIPSNLVGA